MKTPLKNTTAAVAADGLSRLFGFLTTAYFARTLGTASFGVISIGLSVLGYAVMFSTPGVNIMGMREVAGSTDSRKELAGEITSLRLSLSVVAVVLVVCGGAIMSGGTGSWLIVVLFSASAIPIALSLDWYFQGMSRIVSVSVSRVIMYFCYLALALILVRTSSDLVWAPVAFWTANLAAALYLGVIFWSSGGSPGYHWNPGRWRLLLKASLPLGISTLLMQTIVNLPVLIAGALLTTHETGLFGASMKLVFFALIIDRVFNTVFFPVISRYRRLDEVQFFRAAVLGMKMMTAVALPVAVIGTVFAGEFTSLVYGRMYDGAAGVLRWLFPYFVFTTTNTVLMCVMFADKRDGEVLRALVIGTMSLVVLCVLLGIVWRGNGVAVGMSAGEGVVTLLLFLKAGKTVSLSSARTLGPALASSAVMGFVAVVMHNSHPLVAGLLGSAIFVSLLITLGGLTLDDIRFLRERFM